MKSKALVSIAMALTMAASGQAFAQGNSNHGDRGDRGDRGRGDDRREDRGDRRNDRRDEAREHDRRDFGRGHNEEMRRGRGAGPGHQYYRGDRFPAEYRDRYYVVDDWRGHQLTAPPRGYQWIQSGNDYVLIAIATGIIAQLLLGR